MSKHRDGLHLRPRTIRAGKDTGEMDENGTNTALFEGFDFAGIDFSVVDGLELGGLDGTVSTEEHDAALAQGSEDEDLADLGVDVEKLFEEEEMAKKSATTKSPVPGKNPVGRPKKAAVGEKADRQKAERAKELTEDAKTEATEMSTRQPEAFLVNDVIEAVDRLTTDVTQIKRDVLTIRGYSKDACEAAQESREYVKACHEGLNVILSAVTARADAQDQVLHDLLVLKHNEGSGQSGSRGQDEVLSGISSGVMAVQETLDGLKGILSRLAGMQTLVQENGGIVPSTTTFKAPSLGSQAISQPQYGNTGGSGRSIGVEGVTEADMAIVEKMVRRQTKRCPMGGFATALSGHLKKQGRNLSPSQISSAISALGLADENGFVDPSLA